MRATNESVLVEDGREISMRMRENGLFCCFVLEENWKVSKREREQRTKIKR